VCVCVFVCVFVCVRARCVGRRCWRCPGASWVPLPSPRVCRTKHAHACKPCLAHTTHLRPQLELCFAGWRHGDNARVARRDGQQRSQAGVVCEVERGLLHTRGWHTHTHTHTRTTHVHMLRVVGVAVNRRTHTHTHTHTHTLDPERHCCRTATAAHARTQKRTHTQTHLLEVAGAGDAWEVDPAWRSRRPCRRARRSRRSRHRRRTTLRSAATLARLAAAPQAAAAAAAAAAGAACCGCAGGGTSALASSSSVTTSSSSSGSRRGQLPVRHDFLAHVRALVWPVAHAPPPLLRAAQGVNEHA
jgi:hypothetical protein